MEGAAFQSREELGLRVDVLIAGFAGALVAIILLNAIHGALTGVRQRIEDQISAAGDDMQALADIDVFVGWPGM